MLAAAADLLFLLLTAFLTLLLALRSLGLLPPDAAWTPATERRGESEVDMLLRVEANDEGRDVDDLLADAVVDYVSAMLYCSVGMA